MSGTVRCEIAGPVATIVLDDPKTRNALSQEMIAQAREIFEMLNRDVSVRCVVLTGANGAFCSGANVKEMRAGAGFSAGSPLDIKLRLADSVQSMVLAAYALEVPMVAAIDGPAHGAGLDLALFCDLRVAGANAVFAESFLRLGVVSGDGGAWLLPRLVGHQVAAYLTLTADAIGAEEAQRHGLVLETVPEGQALERTRAIAERIAAKPAHSVRSAKRLLRQSFEGGTLTSHLELAGNMHGVLQHTEDQRESIKAFFEKRDPTFVDR